MSEVKDILETLGYPLYPDKNGWRSPAIYRDGDNKTALKIFDDGSWIDFVENRKGKLPDLVAITLNFKNIQEAKQWLKDKDFNNEEAPEIIRNQTKTAKIFPDEILNTFIPDYAYWINRNISEETVKIFKGGVSLEGKLKNRFVFPVFNSRNKIIGLVGRDVTNTSKIKWKILGAKNEFCYPLFLNLQDLKNCKKIILVESIGDGLALYNAGIKNFIVLFGVEMSLSVLNLLIKLDPDKIIISTNNDINKNSVGNLAAQKIYNRLTKYFNKYQLEISLPDKKDFGEMNISEIHQWKQKLKL